MLNKFSKFEEYFIYKTFWNMALFPLQVIVVILTNNFVFILHITGNNQNQTQNPVNTTSITNTGDKITESVPI
jgi:hypothetical protein